MTPIEYIPIFTTTDDQRINRYLKKQKAIQSLLRDPTVRSEGRLNISIARKGGRIRMAVFAVALLLLVHFVAWGVI